VRKESSSFAQPVRPVNMVAVGADNKPRIVVAIVIFVDPDTVSIHAEQELLCVGTTARLNCCRHDNVGLVSCSLDLPCSCFNLSSFFFNA
jgi:hypothetical protein